MNRHLLKVKGGRGASLALTGLLWLGTPAGPLQAALQPPDCRECARAFDRGDYAGAIDLCRGRLQAEPKDLPTRILLARSEAALGRFEAAYDGFREALRLDPRSSDALYYLGMTAGVLAQGEYQRLMAMAPESARAHQLLGESYQAQDGAPEAEAEFKAAAEANPRSVEALVALGDLTRTKSRFDEALSYYSRAAEIAPRSYDALYGLGVCHSYRGQQALAVESFKKALLLDPRSAPAHLALGLSLLQTGQAEAAVAELQAATGLEPRMRQAYYQLGRAYRLLGRSAEAEAATAKVQELLEQELAEDRLERSDPR